MDLARHLRLFGVQPTTLRVPDGRRAKGYIRADFEDAFARYLTCDTRAGREVVTTVAPEAAAAARPTDPEVVPETVVMADQCEGRASTTGEFEVVPAATLGADGLSRPHDLHDLASTEYESGPWQVCQCGGRIRRRTPLGDRCVACDPREPGADG